MEIETLKNVILDQESSIRQKISTQTVIQRDLTLDIHHIFRIPNVLLIKGPRRCGKSFYAHLLLKGTKYRYINFDDERIVLKLSELNNIIEAFHALGSFDYMILDEIQNIQGWERFVSRLREQYKIIVSGSNSRMLSKEFGTHLTGRYLSKTLLTFNFFEFLRFKNIVFNKDSIHLTEKRAELKKFFDGYLEKGGFPEYLLLDGNYLIELYNSMITRDIAFSNIKRSAQFRKFVNIVMNNFAAKLSVNKLSKELGLSSPTLENYLELLLDSFLIFKINRFSHKLKEQEQSIKKIYCIDNGLVNSVTLSFSQNKGRLLENLAAIHLYNYALNNNSGIFYYYNYKHECDFLIKQGNKITQAIQVSWKLDENNKKRELQGLVEAMDEFHIKEGLVLTYEQEDVIYADAKKIIIKPLWKWLLGL